MLANNAEYGCLILKNKQTGHLKEVWFSFEEHISILDEAIKRASRVYEAKEKSVPPERTDDRSLCSQCAFKDICIPDLLQNGGIQFLNSEDLKEKLERREELKILANEYSEIDDEIKNTIKQTGIGEKSIGDYLVQVKEINTIRKKALTWDEEKTSYLKVIIERI
jgi:hypothetical protein